MLRNQSASRDPLPFSRGPRSPCVSSLEEPAISEEGHSPQPQGFPRQRLGPPKTADILPQEKPSLGTSLADSQCPLHLQSCCSTWIHSVRHSSLQCFLKLCCRDVVNLTPFVLHLVRIYRCKDCKLSYPSYENGISSLVGLSTSVRETSGETLW